jgi:hypothetical protein
MKPRMGSGMIANQPPRAGHVPGFFVPVFQY